MHPDDKRRFTGLLLLLGPAFGWFYAVKYTEALAGSPLPALYALARQTPTKP